MHGPSAPRTIALVAAAAGALSYACLSFQGLDDGVPDAAALGVDSSVIADGTGPTCGADLQTDPTNCGACGHVCAPHANSYAVCTNGQCTVGCNNTFANCDGSDNNGCETQIVNDSHNCGACARDCAGGTCNNGQCAPVVLATSSSNPVTMALDTGFVYWGAFYGYAVDKVAKDGGTPTVISQGEVYPAAVTLDANAIYWVDRGYGSADGLVRRATLAGGGASTVVGGLSSRPNGIAVDATHIYYATIGLGNATDGAVWVVALGTADAGAGTSIAPSQNNPTLMAVDAQNLYWTNFGTTLAPDAGAPNGSIVHCAVPTCAGGPQVLASAQSHPRGIAIDGQSVYWTAYGTGLNDGAVLKCAKTGCGTGPTPLAQNLVYPDGIAVDAKFVYFATHSGTVQRVPLGGGTPEIMATATSPSYPLAIAVDDTFVYFSTYNPTGPASILRLLK
jgi:hypothetical protein